MTETGDENSVSFASPEEEIEYWKEKAMEYRANLEAVRGEFDDFQESSRELEAELEAQLEQAESANKDLLSRIQRVEEENESVKNKLDILKNETYVSVTTLEEERAELVALKETLQKYVRQLEQSNDDLERGKRVIMSSLEDFETKLNQAIERNAMLENELDEKHRMSEMCQRWKDEVRDLHAEISRQSRKQNTTNEEKLVSAEGVAATQNGEANLAPASQHANLMNTLESSPLIKANPSPQGTPLHTTFSGTQNFTPSTRISALNMVGDLLRKVGALESRLASCRTHTSGLPQRHSRVSPGMDTPKAKRFQRPLNNFDGQSHNLTKITV